MKSISPTRFIGEGPRDLVFVPGFLSHLELWWEEPLCARFFERLASFSRLILFDKRGTGLSDRVSELPTLELRMDDVRAVMDAAGSERAAVFGISEGGTMSILFAATYPERTAALIVYGGYARCYRSEDYPAGDPIEVFNAAIEYIRTQWGEGLIGAAVAPSLPRARPTIHELVRPTGARWREPGRCRDVVSDGV